MIEKYLNSAKAIFHKNKLNGCFPLESILITFNTDELEVEISHRYVREGLYSVFGTIVYNDRIFEDSKIEALNCFFIENQHVINGAISNMLSSTGIFSEASGEGLFLGNGRSIYSVGLWFMYHTNRYDKSEEPSFKALMDEEIRAVTDSFECVYGVVQYIIDHNPGEEDIKNIFPKQRPVALKPSGLVKKHMNRTVTKEMSSNFFSAVHHLEKAEDMVQQAHMDSAIEEKKKLKQFN